MENSEYLEARIESLFDSANAYAGKIYLNEKIRYMAWLASPTTSQEKKDKIQANVAWSDSIFVSYYTRKEVVLAGGEVDGDFSSLGEPPYSFVDILSTP